MTVRQCSSCGGFCKKSGCERENVQPEPKQEQGEPVAEIKGFDGNGAVLRWFTKSTDFPAGAKFYTTPQPVTESHKRKPPEVGDGSALFYEAVRLLDNAIFAQSGDVVRHDSAAHREALDFFNHVFTRLDLTPSQQRKPLTDEQMRDCLDAADQMYCEKDGDKELFKARAIEAAHSIKE